MKSKILYLYILVMILYPRIIFSQNYGLGLKANTLGINAELFRSFGDNFNLRLGGAFFSISPEGGNDEDDYKYKANADLMSYSLLGDIFPFGGAFRITTGVLLNFNESTIDLVPTETYTVGGDIYTPEELGTLSAKIDFNRVAPYIGMGFGNPMSGEGTLQFVVDLGTFYQGSANVDLSANGLLEPSAAPDQEQQLEENLSWFKWYPVVSFGIVFKF